MRRSGAFVTVALMALSSLLLGVPAAAVPLGPPVLPQVLPHDGSLTHARQTYLQRRAQAAREAATSTRNHRPWHGQRGLTSPIDTPNAVALDARTDTLYVSTDAGPIGVVDARTCNARARRCHAPVASLPGAVTPPAIAVDPARHTLYESAEVPGGFAVLVFDTTRCNARVHTGCDARPAQLPDADIPIGFGVDEATHTLYVGHLQDTIGVVDTAACNGAHPGGCTGYTASIAAGPGPVFPTVDHPRHTLYVPDNGPFSDETGTTLSVIDIARCRAGDTTGCGATPFTAAVGTSAFFATIDAAVDTVYVSNTLDSTISVLPRSTCSAADHSGCPTEASPAPIIKPGLDPQLMAVDRVTQTLYVHVQDSNVVAAVDARACNAHRAAGCDRRPRRISTGAQPFGLVFDQRTRTVYTPDRGADVLQAIDARDCSAVSRRGCRREAPSVPGTIGGWSLDPAHHTYFQVDARDGDVLLTDTNRCTVDHPAQCERSSVRAHIGGDLDSVAIDQGTHTAYIQTGNFGPDGGFVVVDTNTCNVTRHDDCTPRATIAMPNAGFPRIDEQTHTVYIPLFDDGTVAVIPGTTCNASDVTGCGKDPLVVPAGTHPYVVQVDNSTGTIYIGNAFDGGDTLTLLPAAACAAATADCRPVATTAVGGSPIGIPVDPAHHTLYAALFVDDRPGTVALVDTRACNAHHTSGCARTWRQAPGPRTPFGAVVYQHTLFTSNLFDASVSIIDTNRCNAAHSSGCPVRPRRIAVGDEPPVAYPNGRTHTLFVASPLYGTTSLIDLDLPCRTHLCFR